MLKVVVDTNVLVSAAIVQGRQFEILKLVKLGKIKLIISPNILKEFEEVISRKKFGFSKEQVSLAINQILEIAEIVIPLQKISIVKDDPDDNIILECALESNANIIISGDTHLLDLKEYKDIQIVNAAEFFSTYYREL